MITGEYLISLGSALVSSFGAVGTLGWWLSGQFRRVEKATAQTIDLHEKTDNERHEENLERFSQLNVAIAKLATERHRR